MAVVTTIVTLFFILTVHEAAHVWAMLRYGVGISEVGLGLPIRPVFTLPPRGRRSFAITVSPWLTGAYVKPDPRHHDRMDALPYRDIAWIWNAGIVANLITGFGLLAVAGLGRDKLVQTAIFIALTSLCCLARRFVAAYVLPLLAVPALGIVAALPIVGSEGMGLPSVSDLSSPGPRGYLEVAGLLSLFTAITNMLPFRALDNNKVAVLWLEQRLGPRVASAYLKGGFVLLTLCLLLCLGLAVWTAIALSLH